ncbi:hypothetical protein H0H87_010779 [Tephrocybe sp. NHM501043]|nr:hypothetical protein H0H87_010779 [Tephrocybe sp. NHM501043]
MNGFAHHEDPKKAFSIPIAPIPTGSGNGLSLNLLGREQRSSYAMVPRKTHESRRVLFDSEWSTDHIIHVASPRANGGFGYWNGEFALDG